MDDLTWLEVAERVLKGRAERAWVGRFPTAAGWIEKIAAEHSKSANLVRRWAKALEIIRTAASEGGWPSERKLVRVPYAALEVVTRAYDIDKAAARRLAHRLVSDSPPPVQELRREYAQLLRRRAPKRRFRGLNRARQFETFVGERVSQLIRQLRADCEVRRIVPGDRIRAPIRLPDFILVTSAATTQTPDGELRLGVECVAVTSDRPVVRSRSEELLPWAAFQASMFDEVWILFQSDGEDAPELADRLKAVDIPSCGVAEIGDSKGALVVESAWPPIRMQPPGRRSFLDGLLREVHSA